MEYEDASGIFTFMLVSRRAEKIRTLWCDPYVDHTFYVRLHQPKSAVVYMMAMIAAPVPWLLHHPTSYGY